MGRPLGFPSNKGCTQPPAFMRNSPREGLQGAIGGQRPYPRRPVPARDPPRWRRSKGLGGTRAIKLDRSYIAARYLDALRFHCHANITRRIMPGDHVMAHGDMDILSRSAYYSPPADVPRISRPTLKNRDKCSGSPRGLGPVSHGIGTDFANARPVSSGARLGHGKRDAAKIIMRFHRTLVVHADISRGTTRLPGRRDRA